MRFIVRCRQPTPRPEDVATLRSFAGVQVLEEASPRLFLVEASQIAAEDLAAALPAWTIAADAAAVIPEQPRRVSRKPRE